MRRPSRKTVLSLVAGAICVPIGYGSAQLAVAHSEEVTKVEEIPASECPEATAAYAEAGFNVDTFAPSCPTEDEATSRARYRAAKMAEFERAIELHEQEMANGTHEESQVPQTGYTGE